MAIIPYTGGDQRGFVGMHADAQEWNARTMTAELGGAIGVGQPVSRIGGSDNLAGAWDGSSVLGVARWAVNADTALGFEQGQSFAVQNMGTMWVAAGGACSAGSQAHYSVSMDRWSNGADGYAAVSGVEFDTNASDGELVRIRIEIPAGSVGGAPQIEWNWQQFEITNGLEDQWVGYSIGINGVPQPAFGIIDGQPTDVTDLLALYDDTNSGMVIAVFDGDYYSDLTGVQLSIGGFVMTATETQYVAGQTVVRFSDMPGDWGEGDVYQVQFGCGLE